MASEVTNEGARSLTRDELAALAAICDTVVPAGAVAGPAGFFQLRASDLGVPELIARAIAGLPDAAQHARFKHLLGLFENRLVNLLLAGRFRRFSDLPQGVREAYLQSWAESGIAQQRIGFQMLKRLTCFLFYCAIAEGGNPTWPAIGYPGPRPAPVGRSRKLRTVDVRADTTFEADVCVIGSGAGGAVVAAEMAAAGQAVVVLEKGGYFDEADFSNFELEGRRDLYMDNGMLATRDLGMTLLAGRCLGGGTVVNLCSCFRPPPDVLEEWERVHGVNGLLGPEFQASLDTVESRLNVNDLESKHNANNAVLVRGCASLGHHVGTVRRNVRGCVDSDFCEFGCQQGAKQSTLVTYLADAQRHGSAQFAVHCSAQRVRVQGGRVSGVDAIAEDPATGKRHRLEVRASTVVVAAGAVHSPAVLLRSGLAHPALGRNLHLHPTPAVAGFFEERIEPWKGTPQSAYSDQFSHLDRGYGFRFETYPAHPGLAGIGLSWQSGMAHKQRMLQLAHAAVIIGLLRDRDGGRVTLNRAGLPVVDYWPSAYDAAHLIRCQYEAARVLAAAGAREVETLHTPPLRWNKEQGEVGLRALGESLARRGVQPNRLLLFSAHQMGTCRMGGVRATAVANPEGEVYGVRGLFIADSSVFPTALGVNPMITIMGLAHRTAQFIKGQMPSHR
ncbi:MAG: GMC family oxidoreductase N-terminal domain-containing protein [Chloroflexi bacterium]|nr:GMC family oxidoreductase N-terminal domain-containing protein [Chloroflexota bacterium]